GRHLLDALLADGHQVVAAARHAGPAREGLRWIDADFARDTDPAAWKPRLQGIDAVINTVGIFRESGAQTFRALHSEAPRALFAAAADSGVRAIIQLSALGADEQATTAYHLSKKRADDFLARLPVRSAIVQPSLVYGRDGVSARAFRTMASLPFVLRFGRGAQLVQPIHVDDLCAAVLQLLREYGRGARRVALVGARALPFTDYLATLRASLGLGRLRVLTLPDRLAEWLAALGGKLPGALLDADALSMLNRGNTADVGETVRLLGRAPRPPERFIDDPDAERLQAQLGWLLPVLRISIALVWIATAIVSAGLYPVTLSYELLGRTGVPPMLQPLMLYGAVGCDLLLGLGTLLLKRRRWLWRAQLALIGFYTVVIAICLPEFLLHPYGPLTKNLPMLAAIWLLAELEER
ncbi:MAG: SDR family oxidoreductase, partial [Gammaproteobacteria bacterium]